MSQRTIKFRAWDKKNLIMRLWDWLLNKQCTFLNSKHFDSMLFTGLLDRNKKEIFEGNLLEIQEHYCGDNKYPKGIFKVIYKDAEFFATSKLEKYVSLFDATKNFNAVVIGNIYENKNLLKEEL